MKMKVLNNIKGRLYRIRLIRDYYYDYRRYLKYSRYSKKKLNERMLLSKISTSLHVIEKGLSLKNPRPGFGKSVVDTLCHDLELYVKLNYDLSSVMFLSAVSSIINYVKFNKNNNFEVAYLNDFVTKYEGLITLDSVEHINDLNPDYFRNLNYEELAKSRYSIRQFSKEKIPMNLIENSIKIAQKSPSVCNRQSTRVYVINSESAKSAFLNLHNGSRGFGADADIFLLVANDLNVYDSTGERNQAYVDGGIFTMSLLHSLQYSGIASCTLNWATTGKKDMSLRKVLNIKDEHTIICVIACGMFDKNFKVAKSTRLDLKDVLHHR